jgi:hypothetical protein
MSANGKSVLPDIERLVLQARAAHVYLDAMGGLGSAERRAQNLARAGEALEDIERFLRESACDADTRARAQTLEQELRARLSAIRP